MGRWGKGAVLTLGAMLIIAAGPRALAPASGGLWQVGHSARGGPEQAVCIADPMMLAQWEHRGGHCSRVVLGDDADRTVISYTCEDGGFGRSTITVLTPRTLRVETQGIAAGAPFNYTLHARRVGSCPLR